MYKGYGRHLHPEIAKSRRTLDSLTTIERRFGASFMSNEALA
jgi:hypothetical protein